MLMPSRNASCVLQNQLMIRETQPTAVHAHIMDRPFRVPCRRRGVCAGAGPMSRYSAARLLDMNGMNRDSEVITTNNEFVSRKRVNFFVHACAGWLHQEG